MHSYPQGPARSIDIGPGNFGHTSGLGADLYGAGDLLRSVSGPTEADKPMVIELAVAAMEELIRMAQAGEPLWIPSPDDSSEVLSEEEYFRTFPRGIGPKPLGLKSEASRESAVVIMNHINLVEILMDVVRLVLACFLKLMASFLENQSVCLWLMICYFFSMNKCLFPWLNVRVVVRCNENLQNLETQLYN